MPLPSATPRTVESAVYGTHSPTSTPVIPSSSRTRSATKLRASAGVLCIFQLPAMYGLRSDIVERLHSGQFLTLEQLERCTAACGEVGHLVRQSKLREGRRRVAAADDRGPLASRHRLGD